VAGLCGGGRAAALELSDWEDDCDPDDLKSEGVPSNLGASFGGTMSTTIASGGLDSNEFAPTNSRPIIRAPTWPTTERTNAGRMNRFNPIIVGCVDTAPANRHHIGCPKRLSLLLAADCGRFRLFSPTLQ
jgi:hypothetical protein